VAAIVHGAKWIIAFSECEDLANAERETKDTKIKRRVLVVKVSLVIKLGLMNTLDSKLMASASLPARK